MRALPAISRLRGDAIGWVTACAVGCASLGLIAPPARAGEAQVIDAATIAINGTPVPLSGVLAPAVDEVCVAEARGVACHEVARRVLKGLTTGARRVLKGLTTGARVACEGLDGPRFGDVVIATCWADGVDLGAALVLRGWARVDRAYSSRYIHIEAEARRQRRGIWAQDAAGEGD